MIDKAKASKKRGSVKQRRIAGAGQREGAVPAETERAINQMLSEFTSDRKGHELFFILFCHPELLTGNLIHINQ